MFLNYNLELSRIFPNVFFLPAQICKNVEMFGVSVEKLLIKHGKHIINEQFLLNRYPRSICFCLSFAKGQFQWSKIH